MSKFYFVKITNFRRANKSLHHIGVLLILILLGILALTGCRKAPTGETSAVQALYGQRVGVVIRAARYLIGEHGGETLTYNNHIATDSPSWTYALSLESQGAIENALEELFQPVMLATYTTIAESSDNLKFDGDFVLVTPTSPDSIIPPDAALKQIMSDENLAGLIVLDQDWYLDTKSLKTVACAVEITLMDSKGNTIFNSQPGLQTDGEEKLTSFLQDFLQNLTFSMFGEPSITEIQEALNVVNTEMADSIIARLQEFVPK